MTNRQKPKVSGIKVSHPDNKFGYPISPTRGMHCSVLASIKCAWRRQKVVHEACDAETLFQVTQIISAPRLGLKATEKRVARLENTPFFGLYAANLLELNQSRRKKHHLLVLFRGE